MNNNYDNDQQYQYDDQYSTPLYTQSAIPGQLPILILGIIGLALSVHWYLPNIVGLNCLIGGLIVSAIALSKLKAYVNAGGVIKGKAKVGKFLATAGLIVSIVVLAIYSILLTVLLVVHFGRAIISSFDSPTMLYFRF